MSRIGWTLARLTEPTAFLDLEVAKEHLRQQEIGTIEDNLIETYLRAAERSVESDLSISLTETEWELRLDRFPSNKILLPRPPLLTVDSVKYIDTVGTLITMDALDYVVEDGHGGLEFSTPGSVRPPYGGFWPVARDEPQAVRIRYTAGAFTGGATPWEPTPIDERGVPAEVRAAILLLLGDIHQQREVTLTGTISSQLPLYERLVSPHRVVWEPNYCD